MPAQWKKCWKISRHHTTDRFHYYFRSMRLFSIIFLSLQWIFAYQLMGQEEIDGLDSARLLEKIEIRAFAHGRPLEEIPSSIGQVSEIQLNRFSNANLLPTLNTIPGVHMEERSPGSYRLSIRGSSLRSPFGVRNVKVYWNGIPLTDAGGNTYLNLLDFSSVNHIEVVRGPGSSLYGAGTGGILLSETKPKKNGASVEMAGGSFGFRRFGAGYEMGTSKKFLKLNLVRQGSEGYRKQSAMERNFFQINAATAISPRTTLAVNSFYSQLEYQTPGGLTFAQFIADPTQARPAGGPNPGAVEQQARVQNKSWLGGLQLDHDWNNQWSTSVVAFGNITAFSNPAIRNYEERAEKGAGIRTITGFDFEFGRLSLGLETQTGSGVVKVFQNLSGAKGNQTSAVNLPAVTSTIFLQSDWNLPAKIFLTTGFSLNRYKTTFDQSIPDQFSDEQRSNIVMVPRLALLKKFGQSTVIFAGYGEGFSPPTSAEIFPSTAVYNKNLKAERGVNAEVGTRTKWKGLGLDLVAYRFRLRNTIVVKRDESGADYFFNSGNTLQNGVELMLSYRQPSRQSWASNFRPWISFTLSDYQFENYIQNSQDYSGNRLTGTPGRYGVAGLDYNSSKGFYFNLTATYSDEVPLNDANTVFANEYYLFGARAGFRGSLWNRAVDFFLGSENISDRRYSLGNDLNATGGRYFNAAAGRSFFAGLSINLATIANQ